MQKANVSYSDYLNNIPDKISFNIETDRQLSFSYNNSDKTNPKVNISISDEITENVEVNGDMSYECVNTMIKTLVALKNRMKQDIKDSEAGE